MTIRLILLFATCALLKPVISSAFEIEAFEIVPLDGSGTPIKIEFFGKVYKSPPELLTGKLPDAPDERRVAELLRSMVEAGRSADQDTVLATYVPSERAALDESLPRLLADNKRIADKIEALYLHAIVTYGEYLLCIVTPVFSGSPGSGLVYSVTEVDDELYLTNALSGDYIVSQFVFGLANDFRAIQKPVIP